jgi:hypothetical protein
MASSLFINHEHGIFDFAILFEILLHVFDCRVCGEAANEDLLGTCHHLNDQIGNVKERTQVKGKKKEWMIAPSHAIYLRIYGSPL